MMYASANDVERGFRALSDSERDQCEAMLEEAAVLIDALHSSADDDVKSVVACRMVRRVLGSGTGDLSLYPMGASQGSATALGYTQSWTMTGGGSSGELYISKTERRLLGVGDRIGMAGPLEALCGAEEG